MPDTVEEHTFPIPYPQRLGVPTLDTLSVLLHAESKAGKSTLCSTAPTPMLVLDVEGSWKFIRHLGYVGDNVPPMRRVVWDPMAGPPPRHDGTWDVCWVAITQWAQLQATYGWLTRAPHDFQSIVLDSITEAQKRCKANLGGAEAMQLQTWGRLLDQMDTLIRGLRDLALENNVLRMVVFVAETAPTDGVRRPNMQGQIRNHLPYWMDVVGVLMPFTVDTHDENGSVSGQQRIQKLLIGPHPGFVSGHRLQDLLPPVLENPNLSEMYATVYPTE